MNVTLVSRKLMVDGNGGPLAADGNCAARAVTVSCRLGSGGDIGPRSTRFKAAPNCSLARSKSTTAGVARKPSARLIAGTMNISG